MSILRLMIFVLLLSAPLVSFYGCFLVVHAYQFWRGKIEVFAAVATSPKCICDRNHWNFLVMEKIHAMMMSCQGAVEQQWRLNYLDEICLLTGMHDLHWALGPVKWQRNEIMNTGKNLLLLQLPEVTFRKSLGGDKDP